MANDNKSAFTLAADSLNISTLLSHVHIPNNADFTLPRALFYLLTFFLPTPLKISTGT